MKTLLIATIFLAVMASSTIHAGEPETCPPAHPASCGGETKAIGDIRCPNVSGIYSDDNGRIKFEQTDCQFLTRLIGVKGSDGSFIYSIDREFALDGTLVCNKYHACESATAKFSSIDFELNFNGSVRTDDHGLCNHRGYKLAKGPQGELMATFSVFGCNDGFKGSVIKIFQLN